MKNHLISLTMNFRGKKLEKNHFYLGENSAVVKLPLCDDVTTEQFWDKILYFKAHKGLS